MLKAYFQLIKPNDFYYYEERSDGLMGKYEKINQEFSFNGQAFVGYYINQDVLEGINPNTYKPPSIFSMFGKQKYIRNNIMGINMDSMIYTKNINTENVNIERINIDEKQLNNFIETLGNQLYNSDHFYHIETDMSKSYYDSIIPIFNENQYTIEKRKSFQVSKDNNYFSNCNYVIHSHRYCDNNLNFRKYNIINPFGFSRNNIHMLEERPITHNNLYDQYKYKNIRLILSDECKKGFEKITIDCPI